VLFGSDRSTGVKHLPHYYKVKRSTLAAAGIRRDQMAKSARTTWSTPVS
jgi:hypothetical protein